MRTFQTHLTGYFPPPEGGYKTRKEALMEGGPLDMRGALLYTLQDYLDGKAPYVSVAMDKGIFNYGQLLRIPSIEKFFNRKTIPFRVVDTGGAFTGKGTSKLDVCVRGRQAQFDGYLNQSAEVIVEEESNPVKNMQTALNLIIAANRMNMEPLKEDGVAGPKTKGAIKKIFAPYLGD